MKRTVILAIAIAMLSFSCRDDNGQPAAHYQDPLETIIPEVTGPQIPGFSLLVNANFYLLDGEDTGDEYTGVRWASPQMSLGEPVLLGEAARQMTFHGNPPDHGRRFNFIETRRQTGPSGFAFPHQVAPGRLAVVADERSTLFSGPRLVDMAAIILTRGTVVVYDPETAVGDFVQVRGFDYGRNVFVQAAVSYIRSDTLSRRETDVQSAILLRTALQAPAAQAARRDLLLEAALLEHPDSIFHADIFEALHPGATEAAQVDAEVATGETALLEDEDYDYHTDLY